MKTVFDSARGTILAGLAITVLMWLIARWLVSGSPFW